MSLQFIGYINMRFAAVEKPAELFRDMANDKGITKVRSVLNTIRSIFGLNSVMMQVSQENGVYRFAIMSGQSGKKYQIGDIYYIPGENRLDIWNPGSPTPAMQFVGKKLVYKNVPELFDKAGLCKLFERLTYC